MIIARGEHMGLEWIDLDLPGMKDYRMTADTRGRKGPLRVLFAKGQEPGDRMISNWLQRQDSIHSLACAIGFRPFDEAAAFPDSPVAYYQYGFNDFDIKAWVQEHLGLPDDIDLEIEYAGMKVNAYATTMRNGTVTRVKRRVESERVLEDALKPVFRYFQRNCPPVKPGEAEAVTCWPHVNALLAGMTRLGMEHTSRWAHRMLVRNDETRKQTLSLTPEMFTVPAGILQMSLKPGANTNAALADIKMEGGHRIVDDEIGITITLGTILPDTVMAALRGRDVREIVDIPWLEGLTIRTAKQDGPNAVIRAFAKQEPLALPQDAIDDPAAVAAHLRRCVVDEKRLAQFDEDARPLLEAMTPTTLLAVLLVLERDGTVDLGDHGMAGWELRRFGMTIQIMTRPTGDLSEVLDKVLGENG